MILKIVIYKKKHYFNPDTSIYIKTTVNTNIKRQSTVLILERGLFTCSS